MRSRVSVAPAGRRSGGRFVTTTRWLRGRIVDRLRDADEGRWTTIDGPIGSHDTPAIAAALAALARDGVVEIDREDAFRARLATA